MPTHKTPLETIRERKNWLDLDWADFTAFFNITNYCIEENILTKNILLGNNEQAHLFASLTLKVSDCLENTFYKIY